MSGSREELDRDFWANDQKLPTLTLVQARELALVQARELALAQARELALAQAQELVLAQARELVLVWLPQRMESPKECSSCREHLGQAEGRLS